MLCLDYIENIRTAGFNSQESTTSAVTFYVWNILLCFPQTPNTYLTLNRIVTESTLREYYYVLTPVFLVQ